MFARSHWVSRVACAVAIVLGTAALVGQTQAPPPAPAASVPPAAPVAQRPLVMGRNAAVSTGHPLTTAAALEVLMKGGNAFDAGVAAMLVGGVVEQDLYSLGGEGLALVYPRAIKRIVSINGQGWAPKFATIDWYTSRGKNFLGVGLDPAVTPGVLHAALTILERWGTMSFEQVSARAIEYADKGFPLRPRTTQAIDLNRKFIDAWPANKAMWVKPNGTAYGAGETIKLPNLARTLTRMLEAERAAKGKGRAVAIVAARDRFYKGDIAQEMVAFLRAHGAPWELSDFAEYSARIEEPVTTNYRGVDVYTQGFNGQGPTLLQALNILEAFDVKGMKLNSVAYLHTVVEALKLAYADRDTYYADPAFVQTPGEGLLSKAYAKERAKLINPRQASRAHIAGNPLAFDSKVKAWKYFVANIADGYQPGPLPLDAEPLRGVVRDTTHIAIVDQDGNVFDSTPSGAWIPTSVVLGSTGIPMSVRGESFWLDANHAAQVRPRSRPRYTLSPSITLRNGEPFIALGTPGGDNQIQTMLQAFLDIVEFWPDWYPNVHTAFEWPRVQTLHMFGSFYPHTAGFNKMNVEAGISDDVFNALKALGHDAARIPQQSIASCSTTVIVDPSTGNRIAGGDPRRDCYGIAY
jgi:gamma-glutamyltranspeptidase / glutathione hydrolase